MAMVIGSPFPAAVRSREQAQAIPLFLGLAWVSVLSTMSTPPSGCALLLPATEGQRFCHLGEETGSWREGWDMGARRFGLNIANL